MTTLQRMIDDLKVRNRSARTIQSYIAQVAKFAQHFGKSPELLGPEEIRQYQVYLVEERQVSWSHFNQAVCALRFFYRHTLGRDWAVAHIPFPRQPKKLPVVLSQDEVIRLFDASRSLKLRAMLMTAYAAGLRLSEVTLHLCTSLRFLIRRPLSVKHARSCRTLRSYSTNCPPHYQICCSSVSPHPDPGSPTTKGPPSLALPLTCHRHSSTPSLHPRPLCYSISIVPPAVSSNWIPSAVLAESQTPLFSALTLGETAERILFVGRFLVPLKS
jgi:hypothetical protein